MIIQADARSVPLRDRCVQTVVTSPPYFGLRDYQTGRWVGGDPNHAHDMVLARNGRGGNGAPGKQTAGAFPTTLASPECSCGARRYDAQIGLESSPAEYVETMVGVAREIWRVLREDGTFWLNLGDSYANDDKWGGSTGGKHVAALHGNTGIGRRKVATGLKPKDLLMMPARVALALQADGWWVRAQIVIAKKNPMPESVTDRPTRSHEFMFLLTKAERYYYNAKAIMEPASLSTHARIAQPNILSQKGGEKDYGDGSNRSSRRALTNLALKSRGLIGNPGPNSRIHKSFDPGHPTELNGKVRGVSPKTELGIVGVVKNNPSFESATADLVLERNKRDVWWVGTEPNPVAHFATFGEKWIEPCILAGSRAGDLVLDPFLGSGTTGKVCARLGRRWVGLELNPEYCGISANETAQQGLGI